MSGGGLKIAVSKGRILEQALPLLARAGIEPTSDPAHSRKLILDTASGDVQLVILRAADVPTYVQYGAADVGITGKDVLLEHEGGGLYEPLDLGISRCRMVVAGPGTGITTERRLTVATKYVRTTKRYFAEKGVQAQVIKLYGSMELAPLAGLSDLIVDIVDTGNTLRANGLKELETIMAISARLVINKASMIMNHDAINALIDKLKGVLAAQAGAGDAA